MLPNVRLNVLDHSRSLLYLAHCYRKKLDHQAQKRKEFFLSHAIMMIFSFKCHIFSIENDLVIQQKEKARVNCEHLGSILVRNLELKEAVMGCGWAIFFPPKVILHHYEVLEKISVLKICMSKNHHISLSCVHIWHRN